MYILVSELPVAAGAAAASPTGRGEASCSSHSPGTSIDPDLQPGSSKVKLLREGQSCIAEYPQARQMPRDPN